MKTGAEVHAHIMLKLADDPEFRTRLLSNPKEVIEAETGREIPDDEIVVLNEAIASAQQAPATDEPLTQEEMVQVMGGSSCPPTMPNKEWNACHYQ